MKGLRLVSMEEHLPSKHKALNLVPLIRKKKKKTATQKVNAILDTIAYPSNFCFALVLVKTPWVWLFLWCGGHMPNSDDYVDKWDHISSPCDMQKEEKTR